MFTIATGVFKDAAEVTYYATYEAREDAFNASVGRLVPSRLAGPDRFWADFAEIARGRLDTATAERAAFITGNPRDCLAFATPHQVLTAACLRAGMTGPAMTAKVEKTAKAFALQANRHQPLRTLSGGESVKLAMAKAAVAAHHSSRLCIASPFSWLSAANAGLLAQLVARFARRQLPVAVLALEEEDVQTPVAAVGEAASVLPAVAFELELKAVTVPLASAVAIAPNDPARVDFPDGAFALASPCLLMGDNGQGKSLLAKRVTGAVAGGGRIRIDGADGRRRPRMIFQDVVAQVLSRTVAGMRDGLAPEKRHAVGDRYLELAAACGAYRQGRGAWSKAADGLPTVPTLLEIKLLLAAHRLDDDTALIILDEPDWGLSRRDAAAFVLAVVAVAHRMGVPVLIISHKPWWTPLARSRLTVTKTISGDEDADNRRGFSVVLTKEG